MKHKYLFILPTISILFSSCGGNVISSEKETYVPEEPTSGDGYIDTMPELVEDGTIFHAFCWTFNQIRENLDLIKDAGFKTIQTSPVTDVKGRGVYWWAYYQPVSYAISTRSGLGNKADLTALCQSAEEKGIDIIVDIVFNHMATTGAADADGLPEVDPEVNEFEPYIYSHQDETFHHLTRPTGSGSITQIYDGLPDLNTANEYVQQRSLSLLKECIDVGVDGFRFDAAKHIETPTDSDYSSSFWDNTLEVAKEYYKEKNSGKELFVYGEILGGPDGGRNIEAYTKYMRVTDNSYFENAITGLFSEDLANRIVDLSYTKKTDPSNIITWIESHDTYVTSSTHLKNDFVIRSWAYLASKKSSIPLYLARTDDKFTVAKIADRSFEDPRLAVINKFRNRFARVESYEHAINNAYYVNERYGETDAGAIIIGCGVENKEARISFNHLDDGYYFDQISGRQYHIVDGSCYMLFTDESRVVVLTRTASKPEATLEISTPGGNYLTNITVTLTVKKAESASYRIDDGEPVSFTNSTNVTIGNEAESDGTKHTLEITYSNGVNYHTRTYMFTKISLIDGYFNIINLNEAYLTEYNILIWSWSGNSSGYSKSYSWNAEKKILLVNDMDSKDGFLLALFNKGVEPTSQTAWDSAHTLKQTGDINPKDGYFDAKDF